MLKGIPKIISPELLKVLCEMGHGDRLVIADGNFPAASCARRLVRLDGHTVMDVMEAILTVFPLDLNPMREIGVMSTGTEQTPPIWEQFALHADALIEIDRYDFYDKAKEAYCIISTSETALFANALLTKGVVV